MSTGTNFLGQQTQRSQHSEIHLSYCQCELLFQSVYNLSVESLTCNCTGISSESILNCKETNFTFQSVFVCSYCSFLIKQVIITISDYTNIITIGSKLHFHKAKINHSSADLPLSLQQKYKYQSINACGFTLSWQKLCDRHHKEIN